jgi:GT2 family glycosyltransferase
MLDIERQNGAYSGRRLAMSRRAPPEGRAPKPLASVVISTYNRATALADTLQALGKQTLPPDQYEIVVVDDGSTDATLEALEAADLPCHLRIYRIPTNRGVSAGRNLAITHAAGEFLVLLSDDMVVPENFVQSHVDTLRQYPGTWVGGSCEQLQSLTTSSFGRYLDQLEQGFEAGRKVSRIGPGIWEMAWPTARNLSLPRADIMKIGLFDERFRVGCEDQDLAQRASSELNVRFLHCAAISAVHNDQQATLSRYCRLQQAGARDTVRLCAKYPAVHGAAPIVRANGYIRIEDGGRLIVKKVVKLALAQPVLTALFERLIAFAESVGTPDAFLYRAYRGIIGVYMFCGWREGLRALEEDASHERSGG